MKKVFLSLLVAVLSLGASAKDTLIVREHYTPLLTNKAVNPLFDLTITPSEAGEKLETIELAVKDAKYIESISLYYNGTRNLGAGNNYYNSFANESYGVKKFETENIKKTVTIAADTKLFGRVNHFVVGVTLKENTPLDAIIDIDLLSAKTNKGAITIDYQGTNTPRRVGVSVRNVNDDDVAAYRIPGLVTSKKGTLIATYDIRNNSSVDLQEDIQVGISRSTDGGRTWGEMITAMDMRGYGELPDSENGVGDPAILVDDATGEIILIGLWSHGVGGQRNFWGSRRNAMAPEEEAAQVLISRSSDDGLTWSEPENITPQVRNPRWGVNLQGPGNGITMNDGTLVFAFQYLDNDNLPYATIIYSKDHGKTWELGAPAKPNTTEAQVVELADGELMLNIRDNRGGSRSVYTTKDMGATWIEHPTSRKALIEPVCQASILELGDGKTLLFSNPADPKQRVNMTIKGSTDGGMTWNEGILLDEESGWGYSCLTMIDEDTVGILYEGSQACMQFQAIPLKEIFAK